MLWSLKKLECLAVVFQIIATLGSEGRLVTQRHGQAVDLADLENPIDPHLFHAGPSLPAHLMTPSSPPLHA